MIVPPYLQKGDAIAIVSTARKVTETELQPAIQLLKQWGLRVILGKTIGAENHQFAGEDTLRASDFQEMMNHPEVKAIWCARGGYGTVRIIDRLDFSQFLKHPKWIIGYSDVTVLHNHLHNLGIASIHGQMALEIERKSENTRESLRKALFGEPLEYIGSSHAFHRKGKAEGVLVGGNLSMLYSLCGSPTAIDTQRKILFLEDLDEYLYHVDRMMQNLKRNGLLKDLAGLLVGGMNDMNDNTIPFGKTAEAIIAETVADYHYPVCFGFPAGHIHENHALVFGATVSLEVSENSKVTYHGLP